MVLMLASLKTLWRYSVQTQALTGFLKGHKEEPGSGGKGGNRGKEERGA